MSKGMSRRQFVAGMAALSVSLAGKGLCSTSHLPNSSILLHNLVTYPKRLYDEYRALDRYLEPTRYGYVGVGEIGHRVLEAFKYINPVPSWTDVNVRYDGQGMKVNADDSLLETFCKKQHCVFLVGSITDPSFHAARSVVLKDDPLLVLTALSVPKGADKVFHSILPYDNEGIIRIPEPGNAERVANFIHDILRQLFLPGFCFLLLEELSFLFGGGEFHHYNLVIPDMSKLNTHKHIFKKIRYSLTTKTNLLICVYGNSDTTWDSVQGVFRHTMGDNDYISMWTVKQELHNLSSTGVTICTIRSKIEKNEEDLWKPRNKMIGLILK